MSETPQYADDGVAGIIRGWAQTRPELDVSALEVFGRLHRSYLLYRAEIVRGFERMGITEAGFDVLACLRRAEPDNRRTAGELAKLTLVTTGGLTLRVNRLEEAGLVTRHRDSEDARVVYVELTDKGRELVDTVADVHFETLNRLLSEVPTADRDQLAALLRTLEGSVRDAADAARAMN